MMAPSHISRPERIAPPSAACRSAHRRGRAGTAAASVNPDAPVRVEVAMPRGLFDRLT